MAPLSEAEKAALRSRIAAGEVLPLDDLRRIVASLRKSYTAIPAETRKKASARTAKAAPPSEDQLDFF